MKRGIKEDCKKELMKHGYFFHPGGDFPDETYSPKKRGIWKHVDSPVISQWVGVSWLDAWIDYNMLKR